jgi:hypothetical protein
MRTHRQPIVVPEDLAPATAISSLVRAAVVVSLAALDKTSPAREHGRRRFGEDRSLELILRAPTTPTALANTPGLARVSLALMDSLLPVSAGAAVLRQGLELEFAGASSISVPAISLPTNAVSFTGEGQPIAALQGTAAGPTLSPRKLAALCGLTGELLRGSNAEAMTRQVLIEGVGASLDRVLFDSSAGDATRPAGLLNGVPALSEAGTVGAKSENCADDIAALVAAIAPVSGNNNIALIGSPDAAAAIKLRLPQPLDWPTFSSASLPPRTIIAIALAALVSAVEGLPQVDASAHASVNFETSPLPLVDVGGVTARPIASVYQTDMVALRVRWPISWGLRDPRAIAWMQNVNW